MNGPAVGHLTMEISGITHFILKRGATVSEKICGKHCQGSPLVQGGLKVPLQVTVCMSVSVVNYLLLTLNLTHTSVVFPRICFSEKGRSPGFL